MKIIKPVIISSQLIRKSGVAERPNIEWRICPILKTECRLGLFNRFTTITKFTAIKGIMLTILKISNNIPQ